MPGRAPAQPGGCDRGGGDDALGAPQYAIGAKKNAGGDRIGFAAFLSDWLAGAIRDGTWARLYEKDITPLSGDRKTSPAQ